MTDERMDPRFEASVREALSELEPGEVPPALRDAVVAVPRREPGRRTGGVRLLAGFGAIAASIVVAVALVGLVNRLAAPTQPVAASPSAEHGVPAPAQDFTLTLEADDPAADLEAIADVLRARLEAASFTDATVEVAGDRIQVAVPLGAEADEDAAVATTLLTAIGRAQLIGLGPDPIEADATVPDGSGELLVDSGEIVDVGTRADQVDNLGILLTFDEAATARFGAYTTDHVMDYIALVIDGVAVYVPSINEPMTGGEVVITLNDNGPLPDARVRQTIALLLGGALPAPVRMVESVGESPALPTALPGPSDAPTTAPSAMPTNAPIDPASLQYVCSRFPFTAAMLREGRQDLYDGTPWAAALRAHLEDLERLEEARTSSDIDSIQAAWVRVGSTDSVVEFVAAGWDGQLRFARVIDDGGWRVDGFGICAPRFVEGQGLGAAEWVVAPGQEIRPGTTTFDVLVTERACTGSQSADGRIVGPDVFVMDDDMVLVFAARPLPDGPYTCPGHPATRVTVTLPEPLGERRLLDGYTSWPEPATSP